MAVGGIPRVYPTKAPLASPGTSSLRAHLPRPPYPMTTRPPALLLLAAFTLLPFGTRARAQDPPAAKADQGASDTDASENDPPEPTDAEQEKAINTLVDGYAPPPFARHLPGRPLAAGERQMARTQGTLQPAQARYFKFTARHVEKGDYVVAGELGVIE